MAGNGVELVWEGKRKDVERVPLPFQRVEIINESRATREAGPLMRTGALLPGPLLEYDDGKAPWRNKLIWGDNKYVLASLIEGDPSIGLEPLAGKVDLSTSIRRSRPVPTSLWTSRWEVGTRKRGIGHRASRV